MEKIDVSIHIHICKSQVLISSTNTGEEYLVR